jgi:hypothetical protein
MEPKDFVQIVISVMSVLIALIVYISSRKLFLVDIANKRAEKVNSVFNLARTNTRVAGIDDSHYNNFWPEIISEIIISKNILEKLTGMNRVSKWLFDKSDIQYIFWEQLHTSVRMHFLQYSDIQLSVNADDDSNTCIRKKQIKEVINTYLVL